MPELRCILLLCPEAWQSGRGSDTWEDRRRYSINNKKHVNSDWAKRYWKKTLKKKSTRSKPFWWIFWTNWGHQTVEDLMLKSFTNTAWVVTMNTPDLTSHPPLLLSSKYLKSKVKSILWHKNPGAIIVWKPWMGKASLVRRLFYLTMIHYT